MWPSEKMGYVPVRPWEAAPQEAQARPQAARQGPWVSSSKSSVTSSITPQGTVHVRKRKGRAGRGKEGQDPSALGLTSCGPEQVTSPTKVTGADQLLSVTSFCPSTHPPVVPQHPCTLPRICVSILPSISPSIRSSAWPCPHPSASLCARPCTGH